MDEEDRNKWIRKQEWETAIQHKWMYEELINLLEDDAVIPEVP